MLDMNIIVAHNIMNILKKQGKKQVDLANAIGVSKQTMSKMLSGARMINAIELNNIAKFLGVSMDSFVVLPEKTIETNIVHAFMGRVSTQEAKRALEIADTLSDMILFHSRVRNKGEKLMKAGKNNNGKNIG